LGIIPIFFSIEIVLIRLRFILINPSRDDFSAYNALPHLFLPIVTKSSDAIAKLRVIVSEMERRERILTEP